MKKNDQTRKSYTKEDKIKIDEKRDGFVLGEGSGALIIESLESAEKRNVKMYAEIIGGGESADAYHITGTHPDGYGAFLAMKKALEEANIRPSYIDYINAHATSTAIGDLSDNPSQHLQINANKSMTGHLLGAAGAIETIATCLSVYHNLITQIINTERIDSQISKHIDISLNNIASKQVNYAMNENFVFGGHCAAVVLKKIRWLKAIANTKCRNSLC